MTLYTRTLGAGPDIVLIHGWGLHSGVFDTVAGRLAGDWRVTLVDLPGHGGSRATPLSTDISRLAQEVARVAPPGATWLGWSLGGLAALQYAVERPCEPRALILVSTTPRFPSDRAWPGIAPATLRAFAHGLRTDFAHTLRRFLALQVQGCAHHAELLRLLRAQLQRCPPPAPQTLEAGLSLLRETDLRASLARIARPAVLIYGDLDRIVPPPAAAAFSRLLAGARLTCVKGAGHAPFLSHPDEFLTLIGSLAHET